MIALIAGLAALVPLTDRSKAAGTLEEHGAPRRVALGTTGFAGAVNQLLRLCLGLVFKK